MSPPELEGWVRASAEAETALGSRLRGFVHTLEAVLAPDLRCVLLGGSLARGEGMVLSRANGEVLLSDVDVYAVRERVDVVAEQRVREELQTRVAEDGFFAAPLDLAFVAPDYFSALGRALPALQLAHGVRVLWEREPGAAALVLNSLPRGLEVDPEDATRLLWNRLAESAWRRSRPGWDVFDATHRMKIAIDAPLAWLAATGSYHPDREVQADRLRERTAAWDGPEGRWAKEGRVRVEEWIRAVRRAPLRPRDLNQFAALDENGRPPRPQDDPLRVWVWPFVRALLDLPSTDADAGLRAAVREGSPHRGDRRRVARWLRRGGGLARMRRARRWAPLAPVPLTPWWAHGRGGSGDERVYASCILRWGDVLEWYEPLRGLLREPVAREENEAADAWLGRLWADWILGGGRR